MYVCICNAINCRTVRRLVDEGAGTVGAVFKAQGCAVRCGRCVSSMRDMIHEHGAARADAHAHAANDPRTGDALPLAAE